MSAGKLHRHYCRLVRGAERRDSEGIYCILRAIEDGGSRWGGQLSEGEEHGVGGDDNDGDEVEGMRY